MIILLHSIPFLSELMMKLTYWLMNFESTPYFAIFPFWPMGELILRPLLPSKPRPLKFSNSFSYGLGKHRCEKRRSNWPIDIFACYSKNGFSKNGIDNDFL